MGNFICFGIFLVAGIIILLKNYDAIKKCTKVTTGVVVDVEYKVDEKYKMEGTYHNLNEDELKKENISYTVCPTYEYTVGGKTYQKKSSTHYSNLSMKKGEEIKIHYNPNDPEEYYTVVVLLSFVTGAIVSLIGVIGVLSGVVEMLAS